jgi:16S rRNA (guanine527-N7)-methyltransferase
MDPARIAELLQPFLVAPLRPKERPASLSPLQLEDISTYIDILLRWNARINLTAIRDPETIVTRHFGESLFAARCLSVPERCDVGAGVSPVPAPGLIDFGSGAGFPGLPIKIWAPHLPVTLIESSQKKATFLREVIRALTLTNIDVFCGRAASFSSQGEFVTLRAVERFEAALQEALRLVSPSGRLVLLIGAAQSESTLRLAPALTWSKGLPIPLSASRVVLIGSSS